MTDADILALAREHLDHGLCFDRTARITRCTDAELVAFALALLPRDVLFLDAFDEHDICDAWCGLPIEFFNPGPAFA